MIIQYINVWDTDKALLRGEFVALKDITKEEG